MKRRKGEFIIQLLQARDLSHSSLESCIVVQGPGPGVGAMKTVEFKFRSSEIVKIAGDFNSWQPQEMEREGEEWRCLLDLPAGQYAYKYFINGEWVLDETNKSSENEDGARNNVINVQF